MEHSASNHDDDERYNAQNVIDLDFTTSSFTKKDKDGSGPWIMFNLDQVYCIDHILWFNSEGAVARSWNCTHIDCPVCRSCGKYYKANVIMEGETPQGLPILPSCRYGNVLKIRRIGNPFKIAEIAIIGTQGEGT